MNNSYDTTYPIIHAPIVTRGRDGGKLISTLYALNVGDLFLYPGKNPKSLYRAAKREGIRISVDSTLAEGHCVATRIA